jgi:hypothetical protein
MLSISTAQQLKRAGLEWSPREHDFFAIPYTGLDERYFVISDMSVIVEIMGNDQAITFNGTAEWALDYLIVAEAIWIPQEEQLRDLLEKQLVRRGETQPVLTLFTTSDGYNCQIRFQGESLDFEAFGASEAYAAALLHVLQSSD